MSIKNIRMIFLKLQDNNKKTQKLKSKKSSERQKDIKEISYYQSLLYVLKVNHLELTSRYYMEPLPYRKN